MYKHITKELPRMIDVSVVRASYTMEDVDKMIETAIKYNCICVFGMPSVTPYIVEKLKNYPEIHVGGVVGFPSGEETTETKCFIARQHVESGCDEIDMVINIGAVRSGMWDYVAKDIRAVKDTVGNLPLKVILEIAYLTDEQISRASKIAVESGATYVKTGTGWAGVPTPPEKISLIKEAIGDMALIKAAGGVSSLDVIDDMIERGCSRFGIGVSTAARLMGEVEAMEL